MWEEHPCSCLFCRVRNVTAVLLLYPVLYPIAKIIDIMEKE
jgi:hypothetical protein